MATHVKCNVWDSDNAAPECTHGGAECIQVVAMYRDNARIEYFAVTRGLSAPGGYIVIDMVDVPRSRTSHRA